MLDFEFASPTQVIFGREAEGKVGSVLGSLGATRVLIHFGGGSAERSGLLGRIRKALDSEGIGYVEMGGVKPNPVISKAEATARVCRAEGVDFILAVGGGSVIDSAKCVAMAAANPNDDVWDYYLQKKRPKAALPVACVLTIAAAGSELGGGSVLTNENGNIKRGAGPSGALTRPKVAFMNPALMSTLPKYHIGAGIADVLMHTFERYFTPVSGGELTDALAEALLRTVIQNGTAFYAEPGNYEAASEIMWASSLSHNNLTGLGARSDWATHQLGHELSGMFDAIHGATLAAVWGTWARYVYRENPGRFARFAQNVWGIDTASFGDEAAAEKAIARTEEFFRSVGMPTSIVELLGRKASDEELGELAEKCTFFGKRTIGSFKTLGREDILAIYTGANR